jgi:SAM-dependent methyltransferase
MPCSDRDSGGLVECRGGRGTIPGVSDRLLEAAFHRVCFREAIPPSYSDESIEPSFDALEESAGRFLPRFEGRLNLESKTVLDIGCGAGNLCVEAARRGARRVVGVDVQPLAGQRELIARRFPDLSARIELIETDGDMSELGDDQFAVVLSKDSFEHYPDPESFIQVLIARLEPGGVLAVHFAPLWKSPKGGHIDFMTRLPWAHLLFPERVIMAERRRFRPAEEANRFEDIRGGLNKMTLHRFGKLMADTELECLYFATNASNRPVVRAMSLGAKVPGLEEYLTTSITGLWRKPEASS